MIIAFGSVFLMISAVWIPFMAPISTSKKIMSKDSPEEQRAKSSSPEEVSLTSIGVSAL